MAAALCLFGQATSAECLALGNLGYVLRIEGEATMTAGAGTVNLDLAPDGRAPRVILLQSLQGVALTGASSPETDVLPNGLTAHYATTAGDAVGSGGAEVILSGWLDGERPLGVSCSTQQEDPDPTWCLPILGQLRPAESGCDTGKE